MSFPNPANFRLIVAGPSDTGEADFLEVDGPASVDVSGIFAGAFYWSVEGGHSKSNIGRPPSSVQLAGPDGSTFGVSSFPAHSAGKKIDIRKIDPTMASTEHTGDPAMHASDTIDYEIGRAHV